MAISSINQIEVKTPEERLKEMSIELLSIKEPPANFIHASRTGNLIFLSGQGPLEMNGNFIKGKLGKDLSVEEGMAAARLVAINLISVLKNEIGELKKLKQIIKVLGLVNSTEEFTDHSKVINGFSDLMVEVFEDKGKHARSAIGVNSLPYNIAVEIEMIVEVED